jgi:prolyl 4-hydroxylase
MNFYDYDPCIYTIDNFVSPEECEHIIEISKPKMKRAEVTWISEEEKKNVLASDYKGRTNKSCWFKAEDDPVLLSLCKRIADQIECDYTHFESFQIINYQKGEEYKYHYDAWDTKDKERYEKYCSKWGNRISTVLVYLNEPSKGGGTGFDSLRNGTLTIEPKQGKMLVFTNINYDKTKNEKSRHAGLPVIEGEKWAFNLWLREKKTT